MLAGFLPLPSRCSTSCVLDIGSDNLTFVIAALLCRHLAVNALSLQLQQFVVSQRPNECFWCVVDIN